MGSRLPDFVKDKLNVLLESGNLAHRFLHPRCADDNHEELVAFSYTRLCRSPSCGGRGMRQITAHLFDHVTTPIPTEQAELLLSFPLRYLFAVHLLLFFPILHYSSCIGLDLTFLQHSFRTKYRAFQTNVFFQDEIGTVIGNEGRILLGK